MGGVCACTPACRIGPPSHATRRLSRMPQASGSVDRAPPEGPTAPAVVLSVAALLLGLLTTAAVIAWFAGGGPVAPTKAGAAPLPVPLGTALCFGLLAAALAAVAAQRASLSRLLAGLLVVLAAVVGMASLSAPDLGYGAPAAGSSVTTAVCFLLAATAVVLLTHAPGGLPHDALAGAAGALVAGVSAVAMAGHLIGLDPAYRWARLTAIAPYSGLGLIVAGTALAAAAWLRDRPPGRGAPRWHAMPAAIGLCAVVTALSQGLLLQERRHIRDVVAAETMSVALEISELFDARIKALQRMAGRWNARGGVPEDEWRPDAEAYVRDQAGAQAINWVDRSYRIRWVAPHAGNEEALGMDITFDGARKGWLEGARDKRNGASVTHALELAQGGLGFVVFVPLFPDGTFDGFLEEVFLYETLLAPLAGERAARGYRFAVVARRIGDDLYAANEAIEVFGPSMRDAESAEMWADARHARVGDIVWRVRLWPDAGQVAALQSHLPEITFLSGLLIAVLAAASLHFRSRAAEDARRLGDVNAGLEREIAERRRIEGDLAALGQRLKLILDSAAEGIYGLDRQARTTFVNAAAAALTGWREEELLGRRQHDLIHHTQPDGTPYPANACAIGTVMRTAEPIEVADEVFWRKDGTSFPVEYRAAPVWENDQVTGVVVTFVDVTERKRREAELDLLLHAYQEISAAPDFDGALASALTLVCRTTGWAYGEAWVPIAGGAALSASPAWYGDRTAFSAFRATTESLRRQTHEGLVGDAWRNGGPQWRVGDFHAYLTNNVTSESARTIFTERAEAARAAGIRSALAVPIRAGDEVPAVLLFCMTEDRDDDRNLVTLVEAVAAQLGGALRQRMVEDQLRQSNAELEAFTYTASHDLRAPLRGIDGFSAALLEDCGAALDDTGRLYLDRIRNASRQMAELIDALLQFSRLSRRVMTRRAVDLTATAERIVADLRRADPGRRVDITIAKDLHAVGDPDLLAAALRNLLENAWKFTGKCDEARIAFGTAQRSAHPVFFISDNGAGFDPAYADKLFEPFQRLHRQSEFEGTAIGLANVARIIHRHGGEIWAEGAVGEGATFYFTL